MINYKQETDKCNWSDLNVVRNSFAYITNTGAYRGEPFQAGGANNVRSAKIFIVLPCRNLSGSSLKPGPCLNLKTIFPRYGIPILKIRRSVRPSYL